MYGSELKYGNYRPTKNWEMNNILKVALILFFIGSLFWITYDEWSLFQGKIRSISLISIAEISALFIFSQCINGYMLKEFLKVFKINLEFQEWFGLISIQSLGNYLPLSAGLASNAVYLNLNKQLSVFNFVSYVAGHTLLKCFTLGTIGLLLISYRAIFYNEFKPLISIILLALLTFSCVAIFTKNFKSEYKLLQFFLQIQDGWKHIKRDQYLLVKSITSHIFSLIIIALQFQIVFMEIDIEISYIVILLITILTNIIRITSIFPGNLGLRESISGFVTETYSLSFGLGLVGAVVTRVISMFWIFLFGIIFSFYIGLNKTAK